MSASITNAGFARDLTVLTDQEALIFADELIREVATFSAVTHGMTTGCLSDLRELCGDVLVSRTLTPAVPTAPTDRPLRIGDHVRFRQNPGTSRTGLVFRVNLRTVSLSTIDGESGQVFVRSLSDVTRLS